MRNIHAHTTIFVLIFGLLVLSLELSAGVTEKAGTTIGNAPYIVGTMVLEVQSGANYIRIEPNRLPATVKYMPEAPFGTIPVATMMGDTLPAQIYFEECKMGWMWTIPEAETTALVGVLAHEPALIEAAAATTIVENRIMEAACDSFFYEGVKYTKGGEYTLNTEDLPSGETQVTILDLEINYTEYENEEIARYDSYTAPSGKVYDKSGIYLDTVPMSNGCNRITTIDLTIMSGEDPDADIVYFCRGFNIEHEERLGDGSVRLYRPYEFQSPSEWDYMEGVILDGENDRTLLDLRRAETNLYNHYVGKLAPVSSIRWSVMYDGKGKYIPLTVTDEPQWIETGYVAIQVCFLCGEMYNTEIPTDIDHVSSEQVSVKRIENGCVVIIRGGAKYDIFGTKIQ